MMMVMIISSQDLVDDSKDFLEEEECGFGCISRSIDHHLNHDDRDGDDDVGGRPR